MATRIHTIIIVIHKTLIIRIRNVSIYLLTRYQQLYQICWVLSVLLNIFCVILFKYYIHSKHTITSAVKIALLLNDSHFNNTTEYLLFHTCYNILFLLLLYDWPFLIHHFLLAYADFLSLYVTVCSRLECFVCIFSIYSYLYVLKCVTCFHYWHSNE